VGYQDRKATRTTNALLVADNTGQPLAMASPQAGLYHDTLAYAACRNWAEPEKIVAQRCQSLGPRLTFAAATFINEFGYTTF
jgi:lambda repressor-like predicted transcriptional regulator